MGNFRKIVKYVTDKNYRFLVNVKLGRYDRMPDEEFLKLRFFMTYGRELDLDNPQTLAEKLQWLKLYNRKDEYTLMADKYAVRQIVADKIGEDKLIPLLGVWDDPDEIDFDALPNEFVLKCNHNSGLGMCICRDKSALDVKAVKRGLKKGLKEDYYLRGREWPYKNVPRKIIAERYMTDAPDKDCFTDYKFFCFDGRADCVMVCVDRNIGKTRYYFFDEKWNLKPYNYFGLNAPEGFTLPKPDGIDEMFAIAAKLSEGLPFARIDLYNSCGKIYFGEITFYPDSGFDKDILPSADEVFGKMIDLSGVKK